MRLCCAYNMYEKKELTTYFNVACMFVTKKSIHIFQSDLPIICLLDKTYLSSTIASKLGIHTVTIRSMFIYV